MSDNTISPQDASLLLHRFVAERIPVLSLFMSADESVIAKVTGFITSFTRDLGMVISLESAALTPNTRLPAHIRFSDQRITDSTFQYADETELPKDYEYSSGLRVNMKDGSTLVIFEIRAKAP